ncbi:hypothetical protein HPP92_026875 [Vanilla planifolia]|uniref:Uncharacterized protein n=1 Tax=Vanilla planifolia TaxID=51239 RepID=A0A835R3F0_VANPL|nr:hypothetical protein HPP92_026875 [Vanilla planifolia]KAG0484896.1 hypothetical protein HPP92_008975 [Vanilla planifolia]
MPIDTVDPMYKTFLEHLREDGKSYVFEMEDGDNGSSVFVRYEYEQEDMLTDFLDVDSHISSGQHSLVMNGDLMHKRSSVRRPNSKSHAAINFLPSQAESTPVTDSCVDHSNCSPEIRTLGSELDKSFDMSDSIQGEDNLADDSYQEFLSCLKVQDGFMVMAYNSISIIYEGNETTVTENLPNESSFSGSQALVRYESSQRLTSHKHKTEGAICSKINEVVLCGNSEIPDLIICKGDNRSIACLEPCNFTQYDLKLRSFISKPYDQHEHNELWQQANFRNPVVRHKVLRNQCKSFKTGQMGLSYLDHFPDLARKLEHADPQEALKLLRGFFFWLKNLCHEGAYRPWVSARSGLVEVMDHDLVITIEEQERETEKSSAVIVL